MQPSFSAHDRSEIESAALRQFDCAVLPFGNKREDKTKARKRKRVVDTTSAFLSAINGARPPTSRDEAIAASIGFFPSMLALIFPQYALAIAVAGWLWDYLHGDL